MAELGLDLAELWQKRRWRRLLAIIDQLPAHSRYAEAVADDDELARATLHVDLGPVPPPRLSSWDPTVAELRVIAERLGAAVSYIAVLSGNSYTSPALPRPVTARTRASRDYQRERHDAMRRQLFPDG